MYEERNTGPVRPFGRTYLSFYEDRLNREHTEREIQSILRLIETNTHTRFLDMPCGNGRHSLALAERGYAVTGVDINPEVLSEADRSRRAYLLEQATFVCADMRKWKKESMFDVSLSLYTGFGYFNDDHDDDLVLANHFASLKNGGTFIVEYVNSASVLTEHDGHESRVKEYTNASGMRVTVRSSVSVDGDYFEVTHTSESKRHFFRIRLYTKDALEKKLHRAGFSVTSCYGDYDLRQWSSAAPRIILVARK